MERNIDNQLEELKKLILKMGAHVEHSLLVDAQALRSKNVNQFSQVHEIEKDINDDQLKVDSACISILAKQGPVARDLRFILSIIKINTDLERMGDQAVNIAYLGREFVQRNSLIATQQIENMFQIVQKMVREALDAFVKGDIALAKQVLAMDDQVDELRNEVNIQLKNKMKSTPGEIEACLDLILMARNLERLGDHATNVAEGVVYAYSGKDIRHGGFSGEI